MNQATVLKGMLVGGIIGILIGVLFIGLGATLPAPVSTIYFVFGLIIAVVSSLFTMRVNKALKKIEKKTFHSDRVKGLAIAILVLAVSATIVNVAGAQAGIRECIEMWQRIRYVQFVMLGFLVIAGFLAFAPVILGRTILGPILADLQYMAGAMLMLLIFALLLVFPLDAMFFIDNPMNPTQCDVRLDYLRDRGPFLLQIILRLLMPPQPSW